MTGDRYRYLMRDQDSELTESEIEEGWHFCWDFDGLLVGPGMSEFQICRCMQNNDENKTWSLVDAIQLINNIDGPLRRSANCFPGLCGGVLRNGYSRKDLDIVILPLNGDKVPSRRDAMLAIEQTLNVSLKYNNAAEYKNQGVIPLEFWSANIGSRRVDFIFPDETFNNLDALAGSLTIDLTSIS